MDLKAVEENKLRRQHAGRASVAIPGGPQVESSLIFFTIFTPVQCLLREIST